MKKKSSIYSQLELPYLETNEEHLTEIFKVLEEKYGLERNSKQILIDLGAGNGTIIIFSALNYGINSYGFEINQTLIQETKNRIKQLKKQGQHKSKLFRKIKLRYGDLFEQNLKDYNFVYTYSLPTMHKYLNHVFLTAKKGTIIISYKYPIELFSHYLDFKEAIKLQLGSDTTSVYYYQKI